MKQRYNFTLSSDAASTLRDLAEENGLSASSMLETIIRKHSTMSNIKVLSANCAIDRVNHCTELQFEETSAPSWVVDICITTTGVWFRPESRKGFLEEFRKKTGKKKAHFEGNVLKW